MRFFKLTLILIASITMFGCHSSYNGDSAKLAAMGIYPDSIKDLEKVTKGQWSRLGDTTLLFAIDSNRIFYGIANTDYPFTLKRDSMVITFDDDIYHARLKMLSKDTLVMIGTGKDKHNIDSVYRNYGLDSPF